MLTNALLDKILEPHDMKTQIFLLISLSIILISCDKVEPEVEFVPIEYIGKVYINNEDVNPFLQDFFDAGYNSVRGDVIIEWDGLKADLSLLSNIVEIKGSFSISVPGWVKNLQSYDFLNNLKSVTELYISAHASIEACDFPNLERIDESLYLVGSHTCFNEITLFPALHTAGTIKFNDYNHIINFPLLSDVNNIELMFSSRKCDEYMFPLIEHIDNLTIIGCDSILEYQSFKNLKSANKILVATEYKEGESLEVFKNLESVNTLGIQNCYRLKSLDGLDNLKGSIELLYITGNKDLQSLDGLGEGLNIKELKLESNGSLKSLNGIESVVSITNTLRIRLNNNLVDYCSLSSTNLPDTLDYIVTKNGFNPTLEMLRNGQCKPG